MGKASTNAGKDYYLRPDFIHPFNNTNTEKQGRPLSTQNPKCVENIINTEYKDQIGKDLYFKDEVKLDNENFIIDYDGKEFKWIVKNDNKIIILKDVYKRVLLSRKYKFR